MVACRLDPISTALAPHLLPCPGGTEKCLPGEHTLHVAHARKQLCACSQGNADLTRQASSRPDRCRGWAGLSCTLGSPGLCLGRTLKRPSCLLALCVLETQLSKPILSQRNDICRCVMHIVTSLLSTNTEGYCEKFNISNKNTSGLTGLCNSFSFIRE